MYLVMGRWSFLVFVWCKSIHFWRIYARKTIFTLSIQWPWHLTFLVLILELRHHSLTQGNKNFLPRSNIEATKCIWRYNITKQSIFAGEMSYTSHHCSSSEFYINDTIDEFNVDSKAEYSALSSTRSQKKHKKKKLKQTNVSAPLIQYRSRSAKTVRKE